MRAESPTAATILCAAAAVETSRATMSRARESGIQRSLEGLLGTRQWVEECHCLGIFHHVQADALNAAALHTQRLRGLIGDVDDPAIHDRTTVIHPHDNGFAVAQVR